MARGSDRFLTGQAANAVVTTLITHEFSRGWWTSAVQGPGYINKTGTQGRVLDKYFVSFTMDGRIFGNIQAPTNLEIADGRR